MIFFNTFIIRVGHSDRRFDIHMVIDVYAMVPKHVFDHTLSIRTHYCDVQHDIFPFRDANIRRISAARRSLASCMRAA